MQRGFAVLVLGFSSVVAFFGCGGSSDGSKGKGNAPPTVNCEDYCARTTSCAIELCEQDGNPIPPFLADFMATSCPAFCTQQVLEQTGIESKWDCFFDNSCRALFADDVCQVDASYSCLSTQ